MLYYLLGLLEGKYGASDRGEISYGSCLISDETCIGKAITTKRAFLYLPSAHLRISSFRRDEKCCPQAKHGLSSVFIFMNGLSPMPIIIMPYTV